MEKISWRDHKRNMQVLLMVEEQRSLMNAIRVRQRNWIGHILRGNSLLRTALEGKMEGKRTRGKPRIKVLDRIMTEGHTKLSYDELKSAAQDRLNGVITTRTCQLRQRTKKKKKKLIGRLTD